MNHILRVLGLLAAVLLSHAGILAQDDEVLYYPTYIWGDRTLPVIPGRFNSDAIDLIPEKRMREYVEIYLQGRICPNKPTVIVVFEQAELELHTSLQEGFKQADFVREFEAATIDNRSRYRTLSPLANVQNYNFAENLTAALENDCGTFSSDTVAVGDLSENDLDIGNNNVRLVTVEMDSDATNPPTDAFNVITALLASRTNAATDPHLIVAYASRDARFGSDINGYDALVRAEQAFVRGGTFWTAGIWSTLLISIFLLLVLCCGISWITGVQTAHKLDEADEDEAKKAK